MNTPNPITGMWWDLQRANRLPKSPVLSGCEAELQELMKQIDLMVQQKKMDWERERQQLKARLDVREQEYHIQKATLEQKHQEIGQLRSQLEVTERGQKDMGAEYERQLNGLRNEVITMKKEYERLQKKHSRHSKEIHREKNKASTELQDTTAEVKKLSSKLEEFRQKSREWEQQKRSLQKQIDSLESQNKSLNDKCELVQHQASNYQAQLGKRKEMLDSTELNMKAQISQLESQLDRARDTVNSQDTQLLRLKSTLNDAMGSQRRALEEKEQIERELRSAQQNIRENEDHIQQLQLDLDAKKESLHLVQSESDRLANQKTKLEQNLFEKDSAIQSLEHLTKQEQTGQIQQLQLQLQQALADLKRAKRSERHLQEEVDNLRKKLDQTRDESSQLNQQLADKIAQLKSIEGKDLKRLKQENAKMKEELRQNKENQESEVAALQSQLTETTTELHQRNLAMASLSERAGSMERQVRDFDESIERKNAELQVASAQLDALRLENRHLRRTALVSQGTTDADLAEAEKQLRELQGAYSTSILTLEQQNEQLTEDISLLKEQLRGVDETTQYRVQSALRETEKSVQRIRDQEERKVQEIKAAGERKSRHLKTKLDDTVKEYERKLHSMQSELSHMEETVDIQNQSLRRLGLENQAMTNFVDGVDHIVKCPPRRDSVINSSGSSSIPYLQGLDDNDDEDDYGLDPVDLVSAKLMVDHNERTKQLARKLDDHIERFKDTTEATIKKYTSR